MRGTDQSDGSSSEPFVIKSGVKQGCALAPTLVFCLAILGSCDTLSVCLSRVYIFSSGSTGACLTSHAPARRSHRKKKKEEEEEEEEEEEKKKKKKEEEERRRRRRGKRRRSRRRRRVQLPRLIRVFRMAAADLKEQVYPKDSEFRDESEVESQPDEFREFERLDSLLSQLPKRAQHGILKSCDLVLTCIDANKKFIVLGTNIGITFFYSRRDKTMQRLKATNQGAVITAVRMHDGVDDLVAVGSASGEVTIFCLPGLISVQKKQIQKFEVQDLHEHYITCLEWSTNGMKLFSGDKIGQVVVTEIDFYQGMSKSCRLLIEHSTEITQMDYQNRMLLVSTRQRSFVVRLDRNSETVQIGTKERKM
ncbi:WD repeat-containing protein [Elysia marginata]|uniref:WD repeat-containing protein n=1 Tax=Elysia marginata TaxID=1093978 RepID=A0AAV4HSH3_9GAST|nr:WD repeat-containing protein [Elysia marginata]